MPLRISKRDDSPFWQITGTLAGVRVRESTGTDSQAEAEKLRVKRESDILGERRAGRTIDHAIVAYIENGGENRFLDRVQAAVGHLPLNPPPTQEEIDAAARRAFPGYRRGPGKPLRKHTAATIRRQFYVPLAAVLHYAAEAGWTTYRPLKMPKAVRPAPEWAEADWFSALWPHCDDRLKAISAFLPMTGCRIGECLRLVASDIDMKRQMVIIRETKTDAFRTAHLPPLLVSFLRPILRGLGPDDRVFPYNDRFAVYTALRAACVKAGIKYKSTHKIGGHTFATLLRRDAGMDTKGLQATGRWKSAAAASHYSHASASAESRKADVLGDLLGGKRRKRR